MFGVHKLRSALSCAIAASSILTLTGAGQTSVVPFRDGLAGFLQMADLIRGADKFVHYVAWGLDDEMSWSTAGPRPGIVSRQDHVPLTPPPASKLPAVAVEDLRCITHKPAIDPNSLLFLLRCKAAELAAADDKLFKGPEPNSASAEVRVLVWDQTLDADNLAPPANNLDDLVYVRVPYNNLVAWTPAQLYANMREYGSGASQRVLFLFQNAYKNPAMKALFAGGTVVMPTGIQVMVQKNLNALAASHHQKLIVTDKAAFVGGLNSLKEYWDDPQHAQNDARRWTSERIPTATTLVGRLVSTFDFLDPANWNEIPMPLHDTGGIVEGETVGAVNGLFAARWNTNFNPAFSANALTPAILALPNSPSVEQVVGIALATLPINFTGSVPSTEFLYLKERLGIQLIDAYHIPAGIQFHKDYLAASAVTTKLINALTGEELLVRPKMGVATGVPNPAAVVQSPVFVTSQPNNSYAPAVPAPGVFAIRQQYYKELAALVDGSFAYFENQYVGDHEFAIKLFNACTPKPVYEPRWCRADAFAHFVIPYVPGGSGISILDTYKVIPDTVKDEMQNLVWLEIKSAKVIYDRNTNTPIWGFAPKGTPCSGQDPDLYFDTYKSKSGQVLDPNKDPSLLTLDTQLEIRGNDLTKPCPGSPGFFVQATTTLKVRDVMADGAIMSYVLASNPSSPPPGTWTYHTFLLADSIYVHSKHSEFWINAGAPPQTYVIGSANLNTRSLGNIPGNPQQDANDSESALFYTPGASDDFWQQLWSEHMATSIPQTTPVGAEIQPWENQGRANYKSLFPGGTGAPALTGRVVRLDAIERCIDLRGC